MAINLLDIKPHKVSRDLSGYIIYVYGAPKTGKTTLATQMPSALLLAFERGYNTLPGVMAQDVNTWGEMKQIFRELKKDEVRAAYKTIIVDTVDIAADLCQKYICSQLGIDNMGDGGWATNSWSKYKKEFEDVFRGLTMLGYAVVFISHENEYSEKDTTGKEITKVRPAVQKSALAVVENMADIYGYAKSFITDEGSKVKLMLRSTDGRIACGCRFKYIDPVIDFNYESLANALNEAIDKEAKVSDGKFVTDERENMNIAKSYDYKALMAEFHEIVGNLMSEDKDVNGPRITQIIEKYLGKGKKVSETTLDQAEFIYLIVSEIKDELVK